MKLSVFLLVAQLVLSSTNTQTNGMKSFDCKKVHQVLWDPEAYQKSNAITKASPGLKKQQHSSSRMFANLEWVDWKGSLPKGAVGAYTWYTGRFDYVCKSSCVSGLYNPSFGPRCFYPYGTKERYSSKFQILVNKDNFEVLEWVWRSWGNLAPHPVIACPGGDTYVGKNMFGLGKVVPRLSAFYLPWRGKEYKYQIWYQVLSVIPEAYSHQQISDVNYRINEAECFHHPTDIVRTATTTNNQCQEVLKTCTISKSTKMQATWSINRSTMLGVSSSIKAPIPKIGEFGITLSAAMTVTLSQSISMMEEIHHSVSVQLTVKPHHSCRVRMEGHKVRVVIPYTARLSRTYHSGATRQTTITGSYSSIQMAVRAVVDRCEPLATVKPC